MFQDDAARQFADNRHLTAEELERYSVGDLVDPVLAEFEDHLLVCEHCQQRLALEDDFRQGVRGAGFLLLQQPQTPARWRLPKPVWAFGLAALGLIVLVGIEWSALHRSAVPAVVLLQTARGTESQPVAAPAGKPIILVLDVTDLQPLSKYKVEVVDVAGRPVFQSEAVPSNNKLQAPVAKGLPGGAYFIRVYTLARELLREYALAVRS